MIIIISQFADIVNLHFSSLLETLLDCGCTVLYKLLPIWNLVIRSHHIQVSGEQSYNSDNIILILYQTLQLPGHLSSRLQYSCSIMFVENTKHYNFKDQESNTCLLQRLQRLQFKMGQIELQSCNTTQFYSL